MYKQPLPQENVLETIKIQLHCFGRTKWFLEGSAC